MRRFLPIALGAAALLSACGSMQTTPQSGEQAKSDLVISELKVGIAPVNPPMAFKKDGKTVGVEADFAQALAKELGAKVILVETTWDDLLPGLVAKKFDVVMSGVTMNDERRKIVSFGEPYVRVGQMRLVRNADAERFREPESMNAPKVRIAVVAGTTGDAFARANYPQAQIVGFKTVEIGVTALRRKRVDVFLHDAPAIWRISGGLESPEKSLTGLYTPLTDEYLGWATRHEDSALRTKLNEVLATWKTNGTLETALDHWVPVRKRTVRSNPVN